MGTRKRVFSGPTMNEVVGSIDDMVTLESVQVNPNKKARLALSFSSILFVPEYQVRRSYC